MSLSGKIALVTGASQGIGRTCALKLAAHGATVVAAARSQEKLDEVVKEITAAGGKASAFALDVANEDQIKTVFLPRMNEAQLKTLAPMFGITV